MQRPKLIVIRGNSGSGKSTIAKELRKRSKRKIAIVEQDYFRRFVLKEREDESADNIDLIFQTANFALTRGYDVILEGILAFHSYQAMLEKLKNVCPDRYFFYVDVSFEETLRRHATKPNANDFGEEEMRKWYLAKDLTGFKDEMVIPETSSAEEATDLIMHRSGI